ncbi:MAG TPA: hypothetical protein PK395_09195, partial [bacterium]|nr:hypothetical protein [bacterium]
IISALIAFGVVLLFFSRASDTRVAIWQMSAAQTIRRKQLVAGAVLGIVAVAVLGIWKEWGDSLGLGTLEATDALADLAGIVIGFLIAVLWSRKGSPRPQYVVRLRSRDSQSRQDSPRGRASGPHLRSRVRTSGRLPDGD